MQFDEQFAAPYPACSAAACFTCPKPRTSIGNCASATEIACVTGESGAEILNLGEVLLDRSPLGLALLRPPERVEHRAAQPLSFASSLNAPSIDGPNAILPGRPVQRIDPGQHWRRKVKPELLPFERCVQLRPEFRAA